jgi:inosine/xanthosine triphosphatase
LGHHRQLLRFRGLIRRFEGGCGFTHPLKVRVVERAFSNFFEDLEVVTLDVQSGVKAFPDSEDLILEGARNRAHGAYELADADFWVGIEGGVVLFAGRWYDRNYVVVYNGKQTGVGTSASYEVPKHLVEGIDSESDESKKIIDESLGVEGVFTKQGVIGVLKREVIDREKLLADAVVCALTRFLNKDYYLAPTEWIN